MGYQHK